MSSWKPIPGSGHSTGDWNRTNELLVQSEVQRPTTATPAFSNQIIKALRPGIEPDLRASKAHVATTRRREFSQSKECPAGVEPTYLSWKPSTFAARPRTRLMRKFEGRGVKRSELFHTSRFTLQTSRSSGGRTRTFTRLLNREPPYHWATPDCCLIKSGWLDLNQRSRVSGTRGVPDFPTS